jgi:hypothetical protein
MNWEAVAAIGDLIGAVGVIVTLAYLAVQIRRNTLATYANSYQTYTDSIIGNNLTIANNPDIAKWMTEIAAKSFEEFDHVDRVRWSHVILSHLRSLEGLYVQRVLGPIAVNAGSRSASSSISSRRGKPCEAPGSARP